MPLQDTQIAPYLARKVTHLFWDTQAGGIFVNNQQQLANKTIYNRHNNKRQLLLLLIKSSYPCSPTQHKYETYGTLRAELSKL